jgi:GH15 family glucan-1,4-alpha-glucosidase
MPLPIEDYALIGDGHTAALVGRDGSIDWLCLPRFDAGACFAALLGTPDHGRWLIAPSAATTVVRRRYRHGTLILETDFETATGAVRVIDCMPLSNERSDVLRLVVGLRGHVAMRMALVIRFDYGSVMPWVHQRDGTLFATAGPDTLELHTPVRTHGEGMTSCADFEVSAGDRVPFVLNHRPSHEPAQQAIDAERSLAETERHWLAWSQRSTYTGRWQDAVLRSLLTLKALIYRPTGGVVAAPTTSLPEQPGGVRNWDYRYCWLRDATFTLNALLLAGYTDEALAWRDWLLRAVAGSPADMQMLYSVTGERRLAEIELPWLPGYQQAAPVHIGNAAARQFQLDVYGEVMDTLHLSRAAGQSSQPHAWRLQCALLKFVDTHWQEPDEGIWEVRGPRRHFTHSKVMAWVAFDRAVKAVERDGLEGPVDAWRHTRDQIHAQVCEAGFDVSRNSFVQHYGSTALDASLLLIPLVGFLPPNDARVLGTIAAIERELVVDGLVLRYAVETATAVDGLPPGEGVFLPCSFWLADCMAVTGRHAEAEALFERLLTLRNDVGLLSEEFDPRTGHLQGNFPQALSHMALINTARLLSLTRSQLSRRACSALAASKPPDRMNSPSNAARSSSLKSAGTGGAPIAAWSTRWTYSRPNVDSERASVRYWACTSGNSPVPLNTP